MTRQEQIQDIISAVIDFQAAFQSETKDFTQNDMEKLLGSIMVGYSLDCHCLTVEFCSGSCGVDLPYSNIRPDLFLSDSVIFASREELVGIVEDALEIYEENAEE